MKILYFTSFDLSLSKGPSINEREFLQELFRRPDIQVRAIIPNISAIKLWSENHKNKISPIRHEWGASIYSIIASELELERAIRLELGKFKPDIIVGRLALFPFGCVRALRLSNTPFAIKTLGNAGFVANGWNAKQIVIRCLRPLIRLLLRRAVRRASMVDLATNELRSLIIGELGASTNLMFVVPNATNIDRFVPCDSSDLKQSIGIPRQGIVIGYAGGSPLQRGGREVIEVVAKLRADGIDAYGVVVGGDESNLLKLAEEHKIAEHFHAPGRVEYATMPRWINSIDIGIALDKSKRAARIGNSYQKIRQFIA